MNRRFLLWLPLALIALLGGIAIYGLIVPKDDYVHSAMVGKKLPAFNLPPATAGVQGFKTADFTDGTPRLLNLFGSYCVPCIAEAPQLEALKAQGVEIVAVAVGDKPDKVAEFLGRYGNPFTWIGDDPGRTVQLTLGSSGVPETYVIGGDGTILYQHIGDIRAEHVPMLLAKLRAAQ